MSAESLLGQTLTCALCDDATRRLSVWCMECFGGEAKASGRVTPFALCADCNADMHRPAKMALHRRQPFRCNSEELKRTNLPAGLPPLCCLSCSNCEQQLTELAEAQWCQECALILCKDCSKDLHQPQKKRQHQRYPFKFLYISAQHLDDENGMIEEASATRPPTASAATSPATSAGRLNFQNARATMPLPSASAEAAAALLHRSNPLRPAWPSA